MPKRSDTSAKPIAKFKSDDHSLSPRFTVSKRDLYARLSVPSQITNDKLDIEMTPKAGKFMANKIKQKF